MSERNTRQNHNVTQSSWELFFTANKGLWLDKTWDAETILIKDWTFLHIVGITSISQ